MTKIESTKKVFESLEEILSLLVFTRFMDQWSPQSWFGGGFYMDQSNNSKHDGHLQEWVDKCICLLGNSW